ncbi:MAG TPA: hypothetical protein EYG51_08185 [Pseudomonadales bacterium]|nr:hypothetical protein [Pseudomonadales bacterium]
MKITKKKLKRILGEELIRESGEQLELDLEPRATWDYMDEFLQLHPELSDTLTISDFKGLHHRAYQESFRVAMDASALAALGLDGRPRNSDELNDLILKLMARNAGV